MISTISENGQKKYGVVVLALDTDSDAENLSTNYSAGSIAFSISSGKAYILNSSKEWVSQTQLVDISALIGG